MKFSETPASQFSHDHDSDHGHSASGSSRKLALVAGINIVGFLAELAGGLLFGSVALLSDAIHMMFDAFAYVMAFAASFVADNFCSEITIATAHVETSVETIKEAEAVSRRVHDVLTEFGVDHATVELRPAYSERHTHLIAHAH